MVKEKWKEKGDEINAEERELIKLMGKLKRNDIGQSH